MTVKTIDFANELLEAEETRKPVEPLTRRDPNLTVDDAYRIQLEIAKRK